MPHACKLDPPHIYKFGRVRLHPNVKECDEWVALGKPRRRIAPTPPPAQTGATGGASDTSPAGQKTDSVRDANLGVKPGAPEFLSFSGKTDSTPEVVGNRPTSFGAAIAGVTDWQVSKEYSLKWVRGWLGLGRTAYGRADVYFLPSEEERKKRFDLNMIRVYDNDAETVGEWAQPGVTWFFKEILKCKTAEEAMALIDAFGAIQIFGLLAVEMVGHAWTEWPQGSRVKGFRDEAKEAFDAAVARGETPPSSIWYKPKAPVAEKQEVTP